MGRLIYSKTGQSCRSGSNIAGETVAPKATCRQVALKSPVQPKDLEATSIALLQGYSPVQQPLGPLPSSEWPKTYRQIRQRCASCTGVWSTHYLSLDYLHLFTSVCILQGGSSSQLLMRQVLLSANVASLDFPWAFFPFPRPWRFVRCWT